MAMDRDVHVVGREGSPISDSAYNSGPGKPDAPDQLVSFLNLIDYYEFSLLERL